MKIDFSRELKNFDGEALKDPQGKIATLKAVAVEALLTQLGENGQPENISGTEKMVRYILAKKISKGGEIDIMIEEAAKIKELIGRCFGVIVVGQVEEIMNEK